MSDLDHIHHSQVVVVGNLFTKLMVLSFAGQKIIGHAHTFDHTTLVATGRVLMRAAGKEIEIQGPELVVTPAGIVHEFECVSDQATLVCIHAIRNGDDEMDVAPQDIDADTALSLLRAHPLTIDQPAVPVEA